MATLSLRMTDSLHRQVKELAREEGVSINHLISIAVAEKISALKTEDYLQARGKRGSLSKYRAALSQVPNTPPVPGDEIRTAK